MQETYVFIILIIALSILFYVLWTNGYMTTNRKRALLYIGKRGKNFRGAQVSSCTGYVKSVLKIKESKNYQILLEIKTSAGEMTAEIQDRDKNVIVKLDKEDLHSRVYLDCEKRYFLVFRYQKATGEVKLSWE